MCTVKSIYAKSLVSSANTTKMCGAWEGICAEGKANPVSCLG